MSKNLLARTARQPDWLLFGVVLLVAACVFGLGGLEGFVRRDAANVLYSGQQMAQGIPHFVSIFDHSGVFTPLVAGLSAIVATAASLDEILLVRAIFLALNCVAAAGLYLLASTLFESWRVGLLAAFVFVGFECFGSSATTGPVPKAPMVPFAILCLWLTTRRQWFWSGLFGALALLAWQPAGIFLAVAFLLALVQSRSAGSRVRSVLLTVAGALIPILAVVVYFLAKGAFYELIDGVILFNLTYLERPAYQSALLYRLTAPIGSVFRSYSVSAIPIVLGVLTLCVLAVWRLKEHQGSLARLLAKDRFASYLLSFPLAAILVLMDFQSCPDLYVLLPYVAVAAGWFLFLAFRGLMAEAGLGSKMQVVSFLVLCGALVASAAVDHRIAAQTDRLEHGSLEEQYQWARKISDQCGPDCRFVSIGVPEILVLLRWTNPNPYVSIISGMDNRLEATTPGGYGGWLEQLADYDPAVIALGPTEGRIIAPLMDWLQAHYEQGMVGNWTVFLKPGSGD